MIQDVNTYLIDMPEKVKEMVVPCEDGTFTIYLNARLSYESQLHAYEHALKHIENNDFEGQNVQEIEARAHDLLVGNPARPEWLDKNIRKLNRKHRKLEKQIEEYEAEIEELGIDSYALAEHQYLYGTDL